MTDHRTPEEIERDIERDRARLSQNLDNLSERFSLEGMFREVTDQVRYHGSDIGHSVSRTVKENPAALALTGIGLAWMMFGPKRDADKQRYDQYRNPKYWGRSHDGGEAISRPDPSFKDPDAAMPAWAHHDDDRETDSGPGMGDRLKSAGHSVADGAKGVGHRVGDAAMGAGGMVRSGASSVGSGVASAGRSVGSAARTAGGTVRDGAYAVGGTVRDGAYAVGDTVRSGALSAKERAALIRERLAEGTEHMSEAARERVIAARARAYDAHRELRDRAHRSGEAMADFYDAQPLVSGAIAMAIGAAIAGALPRTRVEDRKLGAYRDQLMDEAERIYAEERERAKDAIEAAKEEAKKIAKETKAEADASAPGDKTATQAALDRAKEAGQRVADAAREKADERNLGKEAAKAAETAEKKVTGDPAAKH